MKRRSLAAILAATGLIAAACGSSGADVETASQQTTPEATADPTVEPTAEPTPEPTAEPTPEITADPTPEPTVEPLPVVTLSGLPAAPEGQRYEVWAAVGGAAPSSVGVLAGDGAIELAEPLAEGTVLAVSVEPVDDGDPAPSGQPLLGGTVDAAGSAELRVSDPAGLGIDLASGSGIYILATPTNGNGTNENSGIWYLDIPRAPGLFLPPLPAGWIYEGWVEIDGRPLTSGRIADPAAADDFSGFSDVTGFMPPLPGEDYLINAPDGVEFPTDLAGRRSFISIEPASGDVPAPFPVIALDTRIPADATDHVVYPFDAAGFDLTVTATPG